MDTTYKAHANDDDDDVQTKKSSNCLLLEPSLGPCVSLGCDAMDSQSKRAPIYTLKPSARMQA